MKSPGLQNINCRFQRYPWQFNRLLIFILPILNFKLMSKEC